MMTLIFIKSYFIKNALIYFELNHSDLFLGDGLRFFCFISWHTLDMVLHFKLTKNHLFNGNTLISHIYSHFHWLCLEINVTDSMCKLCTYFYII